jgi:hypothetical protein
LVGGTRSPETKGDEFVGFLDWFAEVPAEFEGGATKGTPNRVACCRVAIRDDRAGPNPRCT